MVTGHRVALVSRVLKACEPTCGCEPAGTGYARGTPLRLINSGQTTGSWPGMSS